jgi:hypothetical protein
MVTPQLTPTEARVLFTVLTRSYAPGQYYEPFMSAIKKLGTLGGNTFACRDCPEAAPHGSRFGGFVCNKHKAQEDAS